MLQLTLLKSAPVSASSPPPLPQVVCNQLRHARTFFTRMIGLLGSKELQPGAGLWITPSTGVHTFGMQFAIDVVALDRDGNVLRTWGRVPPRRMLFAPRKTRSILELYAGGVAVHDIELGDRCSMK